MRSRPPQINFELIASEALSRWNVLLPQWLFGGKLDGYEFKALNPTRSDSKVGSFSINIRTGAWSDFATGDKGGDLVSLYAYLNGMEQVEAAKDVAVLVGVQVNKGNPQTEPKKYKQTASYKIRQQEISLGSHYAGPRMMLRCHQLLIMHVVGRMLFIPTEQLMDYQFVP